MEGEDGGRGVSAPRQGRQGGGGRWGGGGKRRGRKEGTAAGEGEEARGEGERREWAEGGGERASRRGRDVGGIGTCAHLYRDRILDREGTEELPVAPRALEGHRVVPRVQDEARGADALEAGPEGALPPHEWQLLERLHLMVVAAEEVNVHVGGLSLLKRLGVRVDDREQLARIARVGIAQVHSRWRHEWDSRLIFGVLALQRRRHRRARLVREGLDDLPQAECAQERGGGLRGARLRVCGAVVHQRRASKRCAEEVLYSRALRQRRVRWRRVRWRRVRWRRVH